MSLREARSILQRRLQEREANFLRSAKHGIFENPGNPYLALLDLAGCEWGDLERMVHDRGLEDTLRLLRSSGVYVSFEEFKGQRPIVRNGRVIQTSPDDFNNPTFRRYFTAATGGSTGVPRRVMIDVEYWRSRLPSQVLKSHANGVAGAPLAVWAEIPPGYGLEPALLGVSHDVVPDRWFTPVWKGRDGPGWRFRLATQLAIGVARRVDRRVPRPEYLPIDRAEVIVQWARETLETHARCGIIAHVSKALRIALEAERLGIDLTGVTISSGGEPATRAKVKRITETGARFIPNYFCTEIGPIGFGCSTSDAPNDQHLLLDHLAMITGHKDVPGFDPGVNAFYFTNLLPSAPKLLLNVETDDYGAVEVRSCGCMLEELGFTTHLSDIRSFSKATGEGVTLLGTEMVRVLEEELPARFGGSPLDYQLLEEQDAQGFTRIILLVHPDVPLDSEEAVVDAVYSSLRESGGVSARWAEALWRQAGTLRVRREAPRYTARGKFLPLRVDASTFTAPKSAG